MKVLLISTYEMGHQPLGLTRPAALLMQAGHEVACLDLSVQHLDEGLVRGAGLIGISVPMHTATRLAKPLAARVRRLNPRAHLCFYGLYASLNAGDLLGDFADSVIGGEFDGPLAALANQLQVSAVPGEEGADHQDAQPGPFLEGERREIVGVMGAGGGEVFLGRQMFSVPRRDLLPPLERYARFDNGHEQKLAGYVEASHGCAHQCLHCPITPVYGGRLRIVQRDVVLADIRQLVALGARHITFGDPDFFNGVKHSTAIVEAMHEEYPWLTYDATIKVEHLIEHRARLPMLKKTGCAFVVSAVESVDDRVLGYLRKGHTAADVELALGLTRSAGLVLRPTFVAFTPWISLQGFTELLDFVERLGLIYHVDPIQYAIRLLIPRGSSLLGTAPLEGLVGEFDAESLTYRWEHPDPRVDALQREIAGVVESALREGADTRTTFYRVKERAMRALGGGPVRLSPSPVAAGEPVPHLTEPWFC